MKKRSASHRLYRDTTPRIDSQPHTVVGVLSPSFYPNHEVIPTISAIDKPDFFMPPGDEAKKPDVYGQRITYRDALAATVKIKSLLLFL